MGPTAEGAQHEHKVDEFLWWDNGISLLCVSYGTAIYPRSYEHELRFDPEAEDGGDGPERDWCDGRHYDLYTNLPQGWYRDWTSIEFGEYTFGFPMWRVSSDYLYEIKYKCDRQEQDFGVQYPMTDEYNHFGQIGHCHELPCDDSNVFADEETLLIPRRIGHAPEEFEEFTGSFAFDVDTAAHSFEDYMTPWTSPWGKASRNCNDSAHRQCMVLLEPSSPSGRARLRLIHDPIPSDLASQSVFNEFYVKCPSDRNNGRCDFELRVEARRNDGSVTGLDTKDDIWAPRDGNWWVFSQKTPHFADDATHFAFMITGDPGVVLKVDYAQQSYLKRP